MVKKKNQTPPGNGCSNTDTIDHKDVPTKQDVEGCTVVNVDAKIACKTHDSAVRSRCESLKREVREIVQRVETVGKQWIRKTASIETVKGKFPIIKWLPKYRLIHLQGDLIAGLTVGLTVIPQGIAYAKIAELSPQYGLYSAFMGCLIYILFGTSKDVTLGPTAIMSLLTAEFAHSPVEGDATYAILLSLIGGIIQLGMSILNIGFIVDFISHPVINGFTSAAAITIAWSQIKKWLGLKKVPRDFIYEVYWNFRKIPETRLYDFLMGLVCLLSLQGMKKAKDIKWGDAKKSSRVVKVLKYIVWLTTTARNAIVVVLSSVVAAIFLEYRLKPFSLTGNIVKGVPPFKVPEFTITYNNITESTSEIFEKIGVGFVILPILGLVETIAIGKAFARKGNYSIDANQELLAIGCANIMGAFVGAYPVTGSFSRTAVNAVSGVMTPAGGIFTAVLVLLALAFLTPLFYYIPDAALAAVIIMAVIDMIDFSLLKKLWQIKKIDILPWMATFICSLVLGIEWGIIIGIGLSLLYLLYPWARPQLTIETISAKTGTKIILLTLDQGLVFPGIEYFKDKLYAKALTGGNEYNFFILDLKYIANVDLTAVEGLHQLFDDFAKKNKKLIVCNLRSTVLEVIQRAKLKHFVYTDSLDEAVALCSGDQLTSKDELRNGDAVGVIEIMEDDENQDESLEQNYIVSKF